MKNSNFLPGPNNESWLFQSTNSFTCHVPSYRKIHRSDRPQLEFEQGRSWRSIGWSIPAVVVAACRRLPLECRQNRAMWRMNSCRGRKRKVLKVMIGLLEAVWVCNLVSFLSFPRSAALHFSGVKLASNGVAGSALVSLWSLKDVSL